MLLQTMPIIYLANCTVSYKLSLPYKLSFILQPTILQTGFILQIVSSLILQRWAVNYGLITRGAEVDLRSFPSI